MKKILFLLLLIGMTSGDCAAGTDSMFVSDIYSGESSLKQRKGVSVSVLGYSPVSLGEENSFLIEKSIKPLKLSLSLDDDMNKLLLSLGEIGDDFRSSNLTKCRKKLVGLRTKKDPRAYYLLGLIYEKKFDESGVSKFPTRITKSYTLAFVNSLDSNPVVNRLSKRAIDRCIDRADPSKGS